MSYGKKECNEHFKCFLKRRLNENRRFPLKVPILFSLFGNEGHSFILVFNFIWFSNNLDFYENYVKVAPDCA